MPQRINVEDVLKSADKLYNAMIKESSPHDARLHMQGGARVHSRQVKALAIALTTAFNEALESSQSVTVLNASRPLGAPGE